MQPRPPVVLHMIERLSVGGAETVVCQLAPCLSRIGYRTIVCCLRDGPLRRRLEANGVPVAVLSVKRRSVVLLPLFLADVLRTVRAIGAIVREHGVRIIHAHLPDSILLATLAGRLSGVPVVASYHGLNIVPPTGRRRNDPRNLLRRGLYRLAARLCDRSVAVSEPTRALLVDGLGFSPDKTVLIRNGVDTGLERSAPSTASARSALGLAPDAAVIASIGRLVANKGQVTLIEAAGKLLARHPRLLVLLAGDGPDRGRLEARVEQLGLRDRVVLMGERDDVECILAACDAFVLASHAEGISLALLEAMAAERPVVVTAVPGNRDVVVNGESGLLVPPDEPDRLADALDRILSDPQLALRLASAGHERVRQRFDMQATARETARLYDRVLAERGLAPGAL